MNPKCELRVERAAERVCGGAWEEQIVDTTVVDTTVGTIMHNKCGGGGDVVTEDTTTVV